MTVHPIGVAHCPPPRREGTIPLPDGRRLGYAEYGAAAGPLVLWFHGTPGARRQIPLAGRRAAESLGLRLVCVERPGVGDSSDHAYGRLLEWADDVAVVADVLGHERFMVVGLSGGGPYALAVGHAMPGRVASVALLGSVAPAMDEAGAVVREVSGPVALTRRWGALLCAARHPLGFGLSQLVRVLSPAALPALMAFAHFMPEGDKRVLHDPEIQMMFLEDLVLGTTRQCRAVLHDLALFGRPWGFALSDVTVPVHWWHGDADPFVPLAEARAAASLLPDAEFVIRPGESHLGEFAAADKVLAELARDWGRATAAAPATGRGTPVS